MKMLLIATFTGAPILGAPITTPQLPYTLTIEAAAPSNKACFDELDRWREIFLADSSPYVITIERAECVNEAKAKPERKRRERRKRHRRGRR